jgi:hypothetical protein
MECKRHPHEPAASQCNGCGGWFCVECLKLINRVPYCKKCAYRGRSVREWGIILLALVAVYGIYLLYTGNLWRVLDLMRRVNKG